MYFLFVAGSVMYEQATRLSQEVTGKDSLSKQVHCYLAAMNSLRLLHPDNAWIIKLGVSEMQGIVSSLTFEHVV